MVNVLVSTCYFFFIISGCGYLLSVVGIWSHTKPSILAHKHLMGTNLMGFTTVCETSVVYQKHSSVIIYQRRVMSLCQISFRIAGPLVACHQTDTNITCNRSSIFRGSQCISALFIYIWSGNVLRTEYSHVIVSSGCQSAIGLEHIVVTILLDDVRSLSCRTAASCYTDSHVWIGSSAVGIIRIVFVSITVISQTCFGIQFDEVNTAKPGSIRHPEISFCVIFYTRINGVGLISRVVTVSCQISGGQCTLSGSLFIICVFEVMSFYTVFGRQT